MIALRIFKALLVVSLVALVSSCAGTTIGIGRGAALRINGIQMPEEAQANILSLNPSEQMTVIWYYVRGYEKELKARGVRERVPEIEPLDFSSPKKLPNDTEMIGISIFVLNPKHLIYRVVGINTTQNPLLTREWVIYQGINDSKEIRVEGPPMEGKEITLGARVELVGRDGKLVVNKTNIDELTYTVSSSAKN